jgi:hypothetical protein
MLNAPFAVGQVSKTLSESELNDCFDLDTILIVAWVIALMR